MLSFNTNNSAILALDVLRSTTSNRDDATARISSGQRVATAADNAAYWSIATTMRSDSKMLSAVDDALGLAGGIVDSATNGYSAATDVLAEFKKLLVMSREAGVDRDKINTDLDQLKHQLKTIAGSSSFAEQNWLRRTDVSDDVDRQLVGSFRRDADGGVTVKNITYEIAGTAGTSDFNFLVDDLSGEGGILTGSGFAAELGASKNWVLFNGENGGANDEIVLTETTTGAEIEEMIGVVDAMAERTIKVATMPARSAPASSCSRNSPRTCRTRSSSAWARWSMPTSMPNPPGSGPCKPRNNSASRPCRSQIPEPNVSLTCCCKSRALAINGYRKALRSPGALRVCRRG